MRMYSSVAIISVIVFVETSSVNNGEEIDRGDRKGSKLVALGVGLNNVSDVVGSDNGSFSLGDELHSF